MRFVALVLIGYGLGSDRMVVAAIGVVILLCRDRERAFPRDRPLEITSLQFNPARRPDQPGAGSAPDVAIAPWPGAYS